MLKCHVEHMKTENSKMHVLYLNFKKKGGWVERGAMQSSFLTVLPHPIIFLPPLSLYFMTISLRRFGKLPHTVKQDQCVQKANSVSVEFFCSFLCEGFFPRFVLSVICNSLSVFSEVGVFSCFDPRSCTFSSLDTIL